MLLYVLSVSQMITFRQDVQDTFKKIDRVFRNS